MRTTVLVLPSLAALFVLGACADKPARSSGMSTRDSAGVTIVETTPDMWPPPDIWRVSDTAAVDIGVTGGDKDYELHEVQGALGLADGSTVIAEFDSQLRYYDSKGKHIRTMKMLGEGPGEAELFSSLTRYRGDSLWITIEQSFSPRGNREKLLILDSNGKLGRKVVVAYPGRGNDTAGVVWINVVDGGVQATLEDGSFVVSGGTRAELGNPGDFIYGRSGVLRFDHNTGFRDTVATINTSMWENYPSLRSGYQFVVGGADRIALRGRANSFYYAGGELVQVDVFEARQGSTQPEGEPSMRPAQSFRVVAPLEEHTAASKKEFIERSLKVFRPTSNDSVKAAYRARRDSMKTPPFVPAVQDMTVDLAGNIWLELYTSPGATSRKYARVKGIDIETGPSRWVVLDATGRLLGSVMMPENLQVFEIGTDYVLGLWHDPDGIEHVRKHRIVKS